MPAAAKRIAILGFMLESNAQAPVATREEFHRALYLEGEELLADMRAREPRSPQSVSGFRDAMDGAAIDWEPVPILFTDAGASGRVDQGFFDEVLATMRTRLAEALPLDGVYACLHGAATATVDRDPEGTLLGMVRDLVGPDVPVVATLDLHATVSQTMVDRANLLVAFLTNPHVDQYERGTEAARAMLEMFAGLRTARAFVRVPINPPTVSLLTKAGPYADIIRYGQSRLGGSILNVSICAGFFLADTPKAGMTVTVASRGDQADADALARDIAERLWTDRHRYVARLTPLAEATRRMVEVARDPSLPALCFADVADNPGGGGRGNTTYLLKAFHEAGVLGVVLGVFNDPALAAEAHAWGEGARFHAVFNRDEASAFSDRFEAPAEVVRLSNGRLVGRRGNVAGRAIDLGPSARIRLGDGIDVVVISVRQQCYDPVMLEAFGIDIGGLRGLIVKSRGHFRAGFDEFFDDGRIIEVDAPGLATQNMALFPFRELPRPIFPLDPGMDWSAPGR